MTIIIKTLQYLKNKIAQQLYLIVSNYKIIKELRKKRQSLKKYINMKYSQQILFFSGAKNLKIYEIF